MSRVCTPIAKPTTYSTFSEWLERAESALLVEHGIRPIGIRPGAWTKMYIRGLTPEEAAKQVATEAFNKLPSSVRILRRG